MTTTITLGFIGLCFVIGWAATGATRGYLGLIGLALLAGGREPGAEGYRVARWAGIAVVAVLVVLALAMAMTHSRQRLAQLRAESAAREQAFFEIFQAAESKRQEGAKSAPEEDDAS